MHWNLNFLLIVLLALTSITHTSAQAQAKIEIVPILGHAGAVRSVAFSPDGALVLSGSHNNEVKLWDAATGALVRTFEGHSHWVTSVGFSPDGARALSGSEDKTIRLWDVATGALIRRFEDPNDSIESVAVSPDGAFVLSGARDWQNPRSGTIKLWDVATGQVVRTFEGHSGPVNSVAFSPDGTRVLSGSSDRTVGLWDTATGALIRSLRGHTDIVQSVAFSRDGTHILSGAYDNTIKLWDAGTGALVRTFTGHSAAVWSVAFSPDGRHALSGSDDDTFKLWDVTTGTLIRSFKEHGSFRVSSVAYSPDGVHFLSGGFDNTVKLWDAATGAPIRTFKGNSVVVSSAAFSPDGARVLAGNWNGTIVLWDVERAALIRAVKGHTDPVHSVAFSVDGTRALSVSYSEAKLWDVLTGALIRTFEGCSDRSMVTFSPDGASILSRGGDNTLKLWDAVKGGLIRTFEGHSTSVLSAAFSPDGTRVVSGSSDGAIKVWDTASGRLIRSLAGGSGSITSIAFSATRERVLSGSFGETISLWDVAGGVPIRTFRRDGIGLVEFSSDATRVIFGSWDRILWEPATGLTYTLEGSSHSVASAFISSLAFSRDGTRALSGGYDNTIRLWNTATGKPIRTFEGHIGWVYSVAFSRDGTRVLSGSADGTLRIWDTDTGRLLTSLLASEEGEWLAMTPAGFFDASDGGLNMLSVVRGRDVFLVDQFRDQLQRKDLVRELLSGDVLRRHEDEASKLNLQKIIDSGPAPTLELLDNEIERAGDTVRLKVRIFNNEGGGIGKRLIWRVNGQTAGETEPAALQALANLNGPVTVAQALKLDPSRANIVTVTAYNGAGLLASLPLRYKIDGSGATPVGQARPRMFILGIGIDGYREPALTPLKLAVKDVTALARDIKASAEAGGYEKAEIMERLEADATKEKIAAAFAEIAARISRQDALIVLLAGHGKSVSGRYYFMPISTHFGGGRNITTEGIPSEIWQKWIASVQVDKKLLIIDTCESSDAVFITRGSREELARTTAVDRLRQSVGHSVITAARQASLEVNRLGHGILSYAVLEALAQPPSAGGLIQIRDLDAFVLREVPRLSEELTGQAQEPFNKIVGNFPIGASHPGAGPQPPADQCQSGRYILLGRAPVTVRSKPEDTAESNLTLEVPTEVQACAFLGAWTLIGRKGIPLGYVPASAVLRIKE